jgi:hypothetical protein
MMTVVDATTVAGKLYILTDAGDIYSQEKPSDLAYQNVPLHQRPEFSWQRIPGPDVAVPTRLVVGHLGELRVVGDGIVFERVVDQSSIGFRPTYVWREMALPVIEEFKP